MRRHNMENSLKKVFDAVDRDILLFELHIT